MARATTINCIHHIAQHSASTSDNAITGTAAVSGTAPPTATVEAATIGTLRGKSDLFSLEAQGQCDMYFEYRTRNCCLVTVRQVGDDGMANAVASTGQLEQMLVVRVPSPPSPPRHPTPPP